MGKTERKWTVKAPADPEKVGRLATELGVDRVLAELLVQRGIETFEEARAFFRPSLDNLHDPFLMKDMDKAVERLHQAISGGEKILVYGDYDVDGTTAVSLVYSFVRRFTADFREGMAYLIAEKGLLAIALYFLVSNLTGGMTGVVTLPWFRKNFADGEYIYMLVWGMSSLALIQSHPETRTAERARTVSNLLSISI